jgi:hypothetical protein
MREWSNAHEGRNSKVLIAMIISIAHCEYYREILRLTVNHIHRTRDAVSIRGHEPKSVAPMTSDLSAMLD